MRVAIAVALALGIGSVVFADPSHAAIRRPTNIPAQDLGPALKDFAQSRDLQILYFSDTVRNLKTAGAVGEITTDEALAKLLRGTGLTYKYLDDKTITIVPPPAEGAKTSAAPTPAPVPVSPDAAKGDQKPSFWERFRVAQLDQGQPSTLNTAETTGDASDGKALRVEEIVVTAQKHLERLQDVPVPVTAINASALVSSNQLQLQDYYTQIPGLSLTPPGSYGGSTIAIRGLVSGLYANPTVGIVVDDVPYGSPSSAGFGNVVAEIDPSDLAQVEVLRGPQGTLYGASSIGGLLKYVTIAPSTERLDGRLQVGITQVENGDDTGYNLRGNVNVPLSDDWALRASGYTRQDPGYIDDPTHGLKGVNEQKGDGGTLSALYRPSDRFSLRLNALLQHNESEGNNYVTLLPGVGDLEQNVVPHSGGYDKQLQIYSAYLTAELGRFKLDSVTAYTDVDTTFRFDFSPGLGGAANASFGVDGVAVVQPSKTTRFTQELRLSTTLGSRTDWLMGLFYAHEDTDGDQAVLAANFDTGAPAGELLHFHTVASFEEYAAFTNFTFQLTDRFDVQVGGRVNRNEPTYAQTASGALIGPTTGGAKFDSSDSSFTYLLTPRLKLSPDLMLYARFASGYRPGGPNSSIGFGIPSSYGPDKTLNYEVGVKGNLFDGVMSFDASAYYIDWKSIQLALYTVAGYIDNGSRARSRGIELSANAEPVNGLTVSAWLAYNDANLTENLPATNAFGLSGDRLPYSARMSGSVSLRQELPITASLRGFGGVSFSYVGDRKESFSPSIAAPRRTLPSYTKTDLIAGLRYDTWSVNLFLNNLTDERGMVGADATGPNTVTYIQPRTYGVSLAKQF